MLVVSAVLEDEWYGPLLILCSSTTASPAVGPGGFCAMTRLRTPPVGAGREVGAEQVPQEFMEI